MIVAVNAYPFNYPLDSISRPRKRILPVGSVDFCVDWVVRIAGGEDAVMGVRQDRGQGDEARALWPVEHLGLLRNVKNKGFS